MPLRTLLSALPSQIESFPYAGLFILLILGGMGFPFPEDATLILSGFFIANDVTRLTPTVAVVYAGVLTADVVLYTAGRRYGRRVVTYKRFQKLISPQRIAWLEEKFRTKGIFVIVVGRHVIGLRAQILIVSGIMRMPFVKFILADSIAAALTMSIMMSIGYFGGNSLEVLTRDVRRVEHLGVVAVVLLFTGYLLYRYIKMRNTKNL